MCQFAFRKLKFAPVVEHPHRGGGSALSDPRGSCVCNRLALETALKRQRPAIAATKKANQSPAPATATRRGPRTHSSICRSERAGWPLDRARDRAVRCFLTQDRHHLPVVNLRRNERLTPADLPERGARDPRGERYRPAATVSAMLELDHR
jgi:hypothetical protein